VVLEPGDPATASPLGQRRADHQIDQMEEHEGEDGRPTACEARITLAIVMPSGRRPSTLFLRNVNLSSCLGARFIAPETYPNENN
jgi:hypothetical protein